MANTASRRKRTASECFNVDKAIANALEGALSSAHKTAIIEKLIQGMQSDSDFRQSLVQTFIPELFSPFVPKGRESKPRRTKPAKESNSETKN